MKVAEHKKATCILMGAIGGEKVLQMVGIVDWLLVALMTYQVVFGCMLLFLLVLLFCCFGLMYWSGDLEGGWGGA